MKYANLHLHTVYSDGVLTPKELCEKAKEMGYGALSVTDHYTVSGNKEFAIWAERTGLDCILGMEAVGYHRGECLHIVGYDFDVTENAMATYLKHNEESAMIIMKLRFDKMASLGLVSGITWQDVLDDAPDHAWLCNEHIFASLVKRTGLTQADYWDFSKKFRAAKVDMVNHAAKQTAEDMIRIIRGAGGIASLAHPHGQTKYLPELVKTGLNCVEYDHPDIDSFDADEAYSFAKAHGMYVSGGTDHTGKLSNFPKERGDPVPLGGFLCSLATDVRCGATKEEFEALKNRIYG